MTNNILGKQVKYFHDIHFSADVWAGEDEEEDDQNDEAEYYEEKPVKKVIIPKDSSEKYKKAHMNIIFIGHVGKGILKLSIVICVVLCSR